MKRSFFFTLSLRVAAITTATGIGCGCGGSGSADLEPGRDGALPPGDAESDDGSSREPPSDGGLPDAPPPPRDDGGASDVPPPDWAVGRFFLLDAPENGTCGPDESIVRIDGDGSFEYELYGGGAVAFASGRARGGDDPDVVVLSSDDELFAGSTRSSARRWRARRTATSYRGRRRIDLTAPGVDAGYVLYPAPSAEGATRPPDGLVGQYVGSSIRHDHYATDGSSRGELLREGETHPADGSDDGPARKVRVEPSGLVHYEHDHGDGIHVWAREGYVLESEDEAGVVRFTNGFGICMAHEARGVLERLEAGVLHLRVDRLVPDLEDVDGDGDRTEMLWVEEHLSAKPTAASD